jgi:hypothetical protein
LEARRGRLETSVEAHVFGGKRGSNEMPSRGALEGLKRRLVSSGIPEFRTTSIVCSMSWVKGSRREEKGQAGNGSNCAKSFAIRRGVRKEWEVVVVLPPF